MAVLVSALPSGATPDGGVLPSPPALLCARRALSRRPQQQSAPSQRHIRDGGHLPTRQRVGAHPHPECGPRCVLHRRSERHSNVRALTLTPFAPLSFLRFRSHWEVPTYSSEARWAWLWLLRTPNYRTPNRCLPGEGTFCEANAPCKPCPMTPGSDCSRCDNNKPEPCAGEPGLPHCGKPAFPPLLPGAQGCDHYHAIRDVLKVPAELPPGEYVLGWRYDCEATAQVWSNCAVRQRFELVIPCSRLMSAPHY